MYKNILVSGSLAYDYIMFTDQYFNETILPEHINKLSVSFLASEKQKHLGGTAGNIAYNLNILLQDPLVFSSLGKDRQDYMKHFNSMGFRTDYIEIDEDNDTAAAYILSDPKHSQIAFFHPGAMNYGVDLIDLSDFGDAVMLIAPDNVEKMMKYVHECIEHKIDYVFDPGQNIARFSKDDLRYAISKSKITIANGYEFELIKKVTELKQEEILKLPDNMIVTGSEKGSEIFDREGGRTHVPAFVSDSVIETTGAGDAYRAGILAGLHEEWSLEMSAKIGSYLALKAIEQQGTQNHTVSLAEIEKLVGKNIFGGVDD